MASFEPEAFQVENSGRMLAGETQGEGPSLVLCHGLSATRRYVVHGSKHLPRRGYRLVTYDARGHGESDPAPPYTYEELTGDLDLVIAGTGSAEGPGAVLGGHSMGCHTVARRAILDPGGIRALILIGPVFTGEADDDARWDRRAEALERGGPEGFAEVVAEGSAGDDVHERTYRLARDRARLHRHPEAVAEALREVPRSKPFAGLDELSGIDLPTLVVGSHDEFDPGHPWDAAVAWKETIPQAEFVSEAAGEPPLAWQGGVLSREIDSFLDRHGLGPDR